MAFLFSLWATSPFIDIPKDPVSALSAGVGVLGFALLIYMLLRRWRQLNKGLGRRRWVSLAALALLGIPAGLFLGLSVPALGALPPPGLPAAPASPALMVFSAAPWALAAGLFGPLGAALAGLIGGLVASLWETHNLFTPLTTALMALLYAAAVNQNYRSLPYVLLRMPLAAALLLAVVYPLLYLVEATLAAPGSLASRLDYGLALLGPAWLAAAGELLVAGLFAQAVAGFFPLSWGRQEKLLPSPAERSLQARLLYSLLPLGVLLAITLMAGDWLVAGNAARQMLQGRMENAGRLAAQMIPYFHDTGLNLLSRLARDPRLLQPDAARLKTLLEEEQTKVPFFRELILLDNQGRLLAGYTLEAGRQPSLPAEEQVGVQLALNGSNPLTNFAIAPGPGDRAAQVSFISAVYDQAGQTRGVLIGRAAMDSNPFTRPILESLDSLAQTDGVGMLVDDERRILYHPDPALILTEYTGQMPGQPGFFEDTGPTGTRQFVYYQPAVGRPWAVVLAVPAARAQQMAINIAVPLLGMVFLLALGAVVALEFGLRRLTGSLQDLAVQANKISAGQLDQNLPAVGEDEVGQLRRAFEQMRLSLKARLEELNRLLSASQGVASSLEVAEALKPVLEAALSGGAVSARVTLAPSAVPELEGQPQEPAAYMAGNARNLYAALDEQILPLTRQQDRLVLSNLARTRMLRFAPGAPRPEALMAVALRHENQYYGALWVAFDQPHVFTDEEVRFITTLASQAALAAANACLFLNAEIGRQRLAAILASTPDPVLVTDQQNRLLLSNPAAWRTLGLGVENDEGQPIERLVTEPKLLALLRTGSDEKQSAEIKLADGRVFYATASTVTADGQRVGRVCVLRDVTYFKELDALKTEFVSTVSHDLRSPLTLMRGYATMLDMVGDLNEQQASYVRKIVSGVEGMSRLVSNLLDLGRIETGIGLQVEVVAVRDVVDKVVSALQLQATQKRLQLAADIPDNTIPVLEADAALLQQALHNLVENAIKYTNPGGRVSLHVGVRDDRMVFEVRDTGIGIAPVDQPRLFEKFYRGAPQAAKTQHGTGLGLAIVKSIVERHGGQAWVESQLGKGSSFYLSIPLRQPQEEPAGRARISA